MEANSVPAENAGGAEAAPESGGGVDLSPVLDRIGQVGQSVDQFGERLSALEGQPATEQEAGADEFDPYDFDDGGLPGDPSEMSEQDAQKWLDGLINKRAQSVAEQQIQQQIAPIIEQLDDMQTERSAQEFLAQYPEFQDEERAEQFMQHAVQTVESLGLTEDQAGKLVSNSTFLGLLAQASRNQQGGQPEQPAQEAREHPLEPAGGANLGGGEADPALSIVNARRGNAFWGT